MTISKKVILNETYIWIPYGCKARLLIVLEDNININYLDSDDAFLTKVKVRALYLGKKPEILLIDRDHFLNKFDLLSSVNFNKCEEKWDVLI